MRHLLCSIRVLSFCIKMQERGWGKNELVRRENKIWLGVSRYTIEKYLGDIVVGDIGQPQCHRCIKNKKTLRKRKKKSHLWHCDWPMSQCHQSAPRLPSTWDFFPHNQDQGLSYQTVSGSNINWRKELSGS